MDSSQPIDKTHFVQILSIGTLMVSRKGIYTSIHECYPHLKPKVEVILRGLSKLFGVGQQSTSKGKNNGVIGFMDVH